MGPCQGRRQAPPGCACTHVLGTQEIVNSNEQLPMLGIHFSMVNFVIVVPFKRHMPPSYIVSNWGSSRFQCNKWRLENEHWRSWFSVSQ